MTRWIRDLNFSTKLVVIAIAAMVPAVVPVMVPVMVTLGRGAPSSRRSPSATWSARRSA